MRRAFTGALVLGGVAALAAQACGNNQTSFDNGSGGNGTGGTTRASSHASSHASADTGVSNIAVGSNSSVSSASSMGGSGGGCLTEHHAGSKKPLDIIMVFDRSISMRDTLQVTPWSSAVQAITAFVNDPTISDTTLGIDYMPRTDAPGDCALTDYNPPQIPLTALPSGAAQLVAAINKVQPNGYDTPIWPAVFGALQYATDYQDQHPDHKVVFVLGSDGDQNACFGGTDATVSAIQTALSYNGVLTFAVEVASSKADDPSDYPAMEKFASAGGTNTPIDAKDLSKLKDALEQIRSQVLGCDFPIPPPMGQQFDPQKLNINYTPGGGMPGALGYLSDPSKCGMNQDWYYDNPQDPKKILLCPQLCAALKMDPGAQLDFVFGCPTMQDMNPH